MFISHIVNVVTSLVRENGKNTKRSPQWPALEHKIRKETPVCAACGGVKLLQVHHEKPFHLHPELELDPANLIVLCMGPTDCHLKIGHGDDFHSYNPNVRVDAAEALADPTKMSDIAKRAKTARLK